MTEQDKLYEVIGVLEYAHCFRKEIKARNKNQAKQLAIEMMEEISNPSDAEFQSGKVDAVEEIKEGAE